MTTNDRAELDSSLHQIEELVRRITASAERHEGSGDDDIAAELYDVERSLFQAARRLETVVRRLG